MRSVSWDAELGHQPARLLGDELEVVHHHFRQAGEVFCGEAVILGGDAGGAVVEVADTQVFATQRHHGAGTEPEALGAGDGRLDDVETGLQDRHRPKTHLCGAIRWPPALGGFARPSSKGEPAYLTEEIGEAPVPPS